MKKNSSRGFTIVEIMVAAAIMGILAVAFARISAVMSAQNAKQNNLNDVQLLVNSVYGILSHQTSCSAAFNGQVYNPSALPQNLSGPINSGGMSLSPGAVIGRLRVTSLQWIAPDSVIGTSTEMVNNVPTNLTTHMAFLNITVAPVNTVLTALSFSRKVNFLVSTDSGNRIRSCYSTIDSNAVCSQLGGTMTGSRCTILEQMNDALKRADVGLSCTPTGLSYYSSNIGRFTCNSLGKWDLAEATTKCQIQGGTVMTVLINGQWTDICRYQAGSCPSGTSYVGYSTTIPNTCYGGSTSGCNGGFGCITGSHQTFSSIPIETCWAARVVACGPATSGGVVCNALVNSIGCTLP